ncbi:kinesin-domain-containing protein [Ramicandelaber brevisporus]|nr:kinesin-domain-containing protein [Ramicandelaber brevisporus]
MTLLQKRTSAQRVSDGASSKSSVDGDQQQQQQQQQYKVKVLCRVRPFLKHEKADDSVETVPPKSLILKQPPQLQTQSLAGGHGIVRETRQFEFDRVFDSVATQEHIYSDNVEPMIHRVLEGFNATVFCYGVSGAGKTHTMTGSKSDPGIVMRAMQTIFNCTGLDAGDHINQHQLKSKRNGSSNKPRILPATIGESLRSGRYSMEIAFYEIHKEAIIDLQKGRDSQSIRGLDVRERDGEVVIVGLTYEQVDSFVEFEQFYANGVKNRSVASTKLNSGSSRSHAILTINITHTNSQSGENRTGQLHLIDLAGSEDNRKTGNTVDRIGESSSINSSLFTLNKVIEAINAGAARIPFRESKLTRILQDSLGGASHATMIVNVAPGYGFYNDTYNTLTMATKTKSIVNRVVVNSVSSSSSSSSSSSFSSETAATHGGPVRVVSERLAGATNGRTQQKQSPPGQIAAIHNKAVGGLARSVLPDDIQRRPAGPSTAAARITSTTTGRQPLARAAMIGATVAKHGNGRNLLQQQQQQQQLNSQQFTDDQMEKLRNELSEIKALLAEFLSPDTKLKNIKALEKAAKADEQRGKIESAIARYKTVLSYQSHRSDIAETIERLKRQLNSDSASTIALSSSSSSSSSSLSSNAQVAGAQEPEGKHSAEKLVKPSKRKFGLGSSILQSLQPATANLMSNSTSHSQTAGAAAEPKKKRSLVATKSQVQKWLNLDDDGDSNDEDEDDDVLGYIGTENNPPTTKNKKHKRNRIDSLDPDYYNLDSFVVDDDYESGSDSDLEIIPTIATKAAAPAKKTKSRSKTAASSTDPMSTDDILRVINSGDIKQIKRLPGIGAKTASLIVDYLQGRSGDTENGDSAGPIDLDRIAAADASGMDIETRRELRRLSELKTLPGIKKGQNVVNKLRESIMPSSTTSPSSQPE